MLNYSEFFNDLKNLIAFDTVKEEREENAPFGKQTASALNFFLEKAKAFGFETVNYDNYAGEIIYRNSTKKEDEIGIIGHIDTVPFGEGWKTNPLTLTEENGYLFGRGVVDDKGPMLATLYALKNLKDSKINCKKTFRLFVGTNEETGWKDIEYLKQKTILPEYGFSPDGDFPVSYSEKGVYRIKVKLPQLKNYEYLPCGTVINAVCSNCEILAKKSTDKSILEKCNLKKIDDKIISIGKSAHGAHPELGINAMKNIFAFLSLNNENTQAIYQTLFLDKYKIMQEKNEQGNITFSPNLIVKENENYYLLIDCRIPAPFTFEKVKKYLDIEKIDYTFIESHPPFLVNKNCELVQKLLKSYNEITGENETPKALSGSTFARVFEKGCAFGFEFSGIDCHIHEPNECIKKEMLLKGYEIIEKALINLAKE
ncbi:MAG: Sapep family Mn(2+)-dependent dipeptidase [Clostridia bacterium]|nr:Sapep family Mn(2+)-dependent dipeptidase [Clostridia bacterium]